MYALSSFSNETMKNIDFIKRFIYEHYVCQYSFISNRDTQLGIRINHKDFNTKSKYRSSSNIKKSETKHKLYKSYRNHPLH